MEGRIEPALRVYPRVGGGNEKFGVIALGIGGLSPRGRGKPDRTPTWRACAGSIPAWAGETEYTAAAIAAETVYPRVGGGNPRSPTP